MIKISRLADYAVVVLAALSRYEKGEAPMSAGMLAQKAGLPEPTVAKVLRLLAKGGILESVRGASGGYKLSCPASHILIADIIKAIEGPVFLTACVDGSGEECDYHAHCDVRGRWDDVNRAVEIALESITLADMIAARSFWKQPKEMDIYERL